MTVQIFSWNENIDNDAKNNIATDKIIHSRLSEILSVIE